jgi:hypothetical protein
MSESKNSTTESENQIIESKNPILKMFGMEKMHEKDVAKIAVMFKIISTTSYIGTFALCYRYKPFYRFLKSPYGIKMNQYTINKFPNFHNKIVKTEQTIVEKIKNSKYIKHIPQTLGMKTSRFTKAFIENFIFYKLTLPISFPLYRCFQMKVHQNKFWHT